MKKIVLVPISLFWLLILLGNLDGALPENTNAPNELTCGRMPCHNVPINVGDSQVSISFSPGDSIWLPDSTYHLTVKIENPMTSRNGFQILALTEGNQNIGTWMLAEPDKMKIIPGIGLPNRKYVTHKAAGNQQSEWSVDWKAPAAGAGKIIFYASVLSANDNGANTGDEVYSTKIEVEEDKPSATTSPTTVHHPRIYPVPARQGIWVELPTSDISAKTVFSLRNAVGTPLKTATVQTDSRMFFETSGLLPGAYFLTIGHGEKTWTEQVLIQ